MLGKNALDVQYFLFLPNYHQSCSGISPVLTLTLMEIVAIMTVAADNGRAFDNK